MSKVEQSGVTMADVMGMTEEDFQTVAERLEPVVRKMQARKGKLGLDPVLDERRLKYAAPDAIWDAAAAFDKILVWQIVEDGEEDGKVAGTRLFAPKTAKRRNREETPRGFICSAGMLALDILKSNGMKVGDIVHFVKLAPFRRPVLKLEGWTFVVLCLNMGDIVDNEDVAQRLKSGELRLCLGENGKHYYEWSGKRVADPQLPWSGADMV